MPTRTIARLEMIADTQNRMLEGITKERDNAITARDAARKERDSATHDLYIPTRTPGLYITADPPSPNTLTEVLHDLPNDELELIWSSNWRTLHSETYQREDAVTATVNMHGRLGTRVPGIFVAHEEVERPMRIWYSTEDGMAILEIDDPAMNPNGSVEAYKRWNAIRAETFE